MSSMSDDCQNSEMSEDTSPIKDGLIIQKTDQTSLSSNNDKGVLNQVDSLKAF